MSKTATLERPNMNQAELQTLREWCVERGISPNGSYQTLKNRINTYHDEQNAQDAPAETAEPEQPQATEAQQPEPTEPEPEAQQADQIPDGPQMESVSDYLNNGKKAAEPETKPNPKETPDDGNVDESIGLPDEFVTQPGAKRKLMRYVLGTDKEPRFKFGDVLNISVRKDEREAYQAYRRKTKGNCVEIKPFVAARKMYMSGEFPIQRRQTIKLNEL